jgi:hypothetical protein
MASFLLTSSLILLAILSAIFAAKNGSKTLAAIAAMLFFMPAAFLWTSGVDLQGATANYHYQNITTSAIMHTCNEKNESWIENTSDSLEFNGGECIGTISESVLTSTQSQLASIETPAEVWKDYQTNALSIVLFLLALFFAIQVVLPRGKGA